MPKKLVLSPAQPLQDGCPWGACCPAKSHSGCAADCSVMNEICRVFGPRRESAESGFCFVPGCDPFIWQDAVRDGTTEMAFSAYPEHELGLQCVSWDIARADDGFLWSCYEELGDEAARKPAAMKWLGSRKARLRHTVPVPHGWLGEKLAFDVLRRVPFVVTLVPHRLLNLCSFCAAAGTRRCHWPLRAPDLAIGYCDPDFSLPDAGLERLAVRALETEILCDWLERWIGSRWEDGDA